VLERAVKGITHDKAAISVAPPKAYSRRFLDFVTHKVFMSENDYNEQRQIQQPAHAQQQFTQAVSLAGRRVSEASSVDDGILVGQMPQAMQYQQQQYAAAKQFGPAVQLAPIATAAEAGPAAKPFAIAGAQADVVAAAARMDGGVPDTPHTPLLSPDDTRILAAGAAADMNLGLLGSPDAMASLAGTAGSSSGGGTTGSTTITYGSGSTAAAAAAVAAGALAVAAAAAFGAGTELGGGGYVEPVLLQQQQQQGVGPTLMQLVSAEEVSVAVVQVSEGGEGTQYSSSNSPTTTNSSSSGSRQGGVLQQQQQQLVGVPHTSVSSVPSVHPAVVEEPQQQQVGVRVLHKAAGRAGALKQQQEQQGGQVLLHGSRGVRGYDEEGQQGGSSSPAEAEVIVVDSNRQQQQPSLGSQHAKVLAKLACDGQ